MLCDSFRKFGWWQQYGAATLIMKMLPSQPPTNLTFCEWSVSGNPLWESAIVLCHSGPWLGNYHPCVGYHEMVCGMWGRYRWEQRQSWQMELRVVAQYATTQHQTPRPYHGDSSGFNSLWPSETIWWYRSGSTLAQVMACCLTAPSHYLNQCWLIIGSIHLKVILTVMLNIYIIDMSLKIANLRL